MMNYATRKSNLERSVLIFWSILFASYDNGTTVAVIATYSILCSGTFINDVDEKFNIF